MTRFGELVGQFDASGPYRVGGLLGGRVGARPVGDCVTGVPGVLGTPYLRGREAVGRKRITALSRQLHNGINGNHLCREIRQRPKLDRISTNELVADRCLLGDPFESFIRQLAQLFSGIRIRNGLYPTLPRVSRTQLPLTPPHQHLLSRRLPPAENAREPNNIKVQLIRRPLPPRLERLTRKAPASCPRPHMPTLQCHAQTLPTGATSESNRREQQARATDSPAAGVVRVVPGTPWRERTDQLLRHPPNCRPISGGLSDCGDAGGVRAEAVGAARVGQHRSSTHQTSASSRARTPPLTRGDGGPPPHIN
ncbi:MAG: hypothetical protein QOH84_2030 [Kribbellaceae bacterium]|nr:hypothetical protein [Kribbellaceae bacterium]